METKELLKYGIVGAIIVAGVIYYMKKQKEEKPSNKPSEKQKAEPSNMGSSLPSAPSTPVNTPSSQPLISSGTITLTRKEQGKGTKGDTVSYKETVVTTDASKLLTDAVKKK